jgi:hypothetical protein
MVGETRVGPGTELKLMLRRMFITPRSTCKCDERARMMDEWGPDGCEEHFDEIVEWLEEEGRKRYLPFAKYGAQILVRKAIARAREKLEMLA